MPLIVGMIYNYLSILFLSALVLGREVGDVDVRQWGNIMDWNHTVLLRCGRRLMILYVGVVSEFYGHVASSI
jgi:hypothetical protein